MRRIILVIETKPVSLSLSSVPKTLLQTAWGFINDSFRLPLCLMYNPPAIAAAALYLAVKRERSIGEDGGGRADAVLPSQATLDACWSFFNTDWDTIKGACVVYVCVCVGRRGGGGQFLWNILIIVMI